MADSFFGLETSLSNLNDDEGGGEPFEDEYDALNDETFGQVGDVDWEMEHEHLAEQLESSRRHNTSALQDETAASSQLEASLSQLVLDETDAPQSRSSINNVWGLRLPNAAAPTPLPILKNVCTVEELERQLRQKQMQQPPAVSNQTNQSFFQPRFPPVILQRPPGLQAPVPLPFAPQQSMTNMNQMTQPINKMIGHNNQLSQSNMMQNQLSQNLNQLSQPVNQLGQNINQLNQSQLNQLSQNQFLQTNQMNNFQNNQLGQGNLMNLQQSMQIGQSNQLMQNHVNQNMSQLNQNTQNQLVQNMNHLSQNTQNVNQLGQNMNQLTQNMSQMVHNVQNVNPLGPNITQLTQNMSQLSQNAQNLNQLGQSMNQMTHNMNQMSQNAQNVSHLGQNLNQLGQTLNQLSQNAQNVNPMGQNINQLSQNMNPLNQNTQSVNQMGQSMNPLAQNMNQLAQSNQNMNQMMPNGGQFGPGMGQGINQFHMMNQQRMMAPPPGMSMPRQNFNQNITQYNVNFRGPTVSKPDQPMNQQNMLLNPQLMQQQIKNQSPHNQNVKMNPQQRTSSPKPGQSQPKLNHNLPQNQVVHNQLNQNQLGHNQLGQNQQGQNQLVQNQPIQKPQKSRVYNNSQNNQKPNLTSQNMVQMIQNTHPMLNSNFSMYHNVSHHPMLNNRNVFNNVLNNHPMFNQRHNGTYNNNVNRSMMNGDNSSTFSDTDEYAGLMTQREKQWLINIQMLQLNTGTPYLHDFYYTVFLERQRHKEKEGVKEAHKANQQNHPFYSGAVKQETQTHTRERHNSHRHNSTSEDTAAPRTYVPAQFENSLGKLQCGSVTAPRKIIDAEVVSGEAPSARASRAPSVASTTHPAEVPREMKRTKQLLLDIEALYLILLRLEELNDPLAISNALILKEREEKQKQLEAAQKEALEAEQEEDTNLFLRNIESVQRRPKPDSPKSESVDKRQVVSLASNQKPTPVKNLLDEDKDDLISKMFVGLLHGDRLPQMLTVRKGRTLLGRFLNRVAASHPRLRALWSRVLRALPSAARRDDGSLVQLAQHYRKYIQYSTGWSAILESCSLLSEAFDPARTPYALTSAFTLSCVCALMEKASMLVNTPEATSNERQWNKFLKTLARALKNTTLTVAKPAQPLSETRVLNHVKLLESRSTIEILQRGKSAAEFADLSKADVSEQLIKHLC